jgi:two-component system, sensor histidine kinase PdtaS
LKNSPSDNLYIYLKPTYEAEFSYTLDIGDNGKGFEFESTLSSSETLGLMLINELTNQLNGRLTQDTSRPGTHYRINFSGNE